MESVPSVKGMTYQKAVLTLQAAFPSCSVKVSGSDAADAIVKSVSPGDKVQKGYNGTFYLTTEESELYVPDVKGQPEETAKRALKDKGLIPMTKAEENDKPKGTVFKVEPGVGSKVKKGDTVTIYVSLGKETQKQVKDFTFHMANPFKDPNTKAWNEKSEGTIKFRCKDASGKKVFEEEKFYKFDDFGGQNEVIVTISKEVDNNIDPNSCQITAKLGFSDVSVWK